MKEWPIIRRLNAIYFLSSPGSIERGRLCRVLQTQNQWTAPLQQTKHNVEGWGVLEQRPRCHGVQPLRRRTSERSFRTPNLCPPRCLPVRRELMRNTVELVNHRLAGEQQLVFGFGRSQIPGTGLARRCFERSGVKIGVGSSSTLSTLRNRT